MEQQDFMPVGPHSFTVAHTILEARAVPKWDTKSLNQQHAAMLTTKAGIMITQMIVCCRPMVNELLCGSLALREPLLLTTCLLFQLWSHVVNEEKWSHLTLAVGRMHCPIALKIYKLEASKCQAQGAKCLAPSCI